MTPEKKNRVQLTGLESCYECYHYWHHDPHIECPCDNFEYFKPIEDK